MRDQAADDRFAACSHCHYLSNHSFFFRLRPAMTRGFVDHAISQQADAVGFDLDHIARHKIARRIEPCAGAGRRSRDDDVARHQRGEGRDVVDQIAEAENQPAGAVILAQFAVDPRGEPDVGDLRFIGVGYQPWPEAAGRVEILALRHVELGVADPIADGAFVAQCDGRDVIQCSAFRDMPPGFADDQNDFAFVVELRRGARAQQRRPVADEGARRAHEHAMDISARPGRPCIRHCGRGS